MSSSLARPRASGPLLDLVYDLAPTSRLGCQITLTETLDGLTVALPGAVRDLLAE